MERWEKARRWLIEDNETSDHPSEPGSLRPREPLSHRVARIPPADYAWRNHSYVIRYRVIRSFRDRRTVSLFQGQLVRSVDRRIIARARRKLRMIHAAQSLDELGVIPGNRLEALHGDRKGQHSVRINDQWRICFVWRDGEAHDVEVTDYH